MDFFTHHLTHHITIPTIWAISSLCLLAGLALIILLLLLKVKNIHRNLYHTRQHLTEERRRNETLQDQIHQHRLRGAKLATLLKNERRNSGEKLALLEEAKEHMNLQFQSLANRIFEEKNHRFSQENKERLTSLLKPLQEQLHGFQQRMDNIHADDTRERTSLRSEIEHLRELNHHINKEAANLTRALQGDTKKQGDWGELVLERLLEKSGLRKGEEYTIQGGYRSKTNRLLKPDVILHLPDNRNIIIDSKVSLTAWQRYISAETEEERKHHLNFHIRSLRNHIKGLSDKSYSDIEELASLDFVILFIPMDNSFAAACEADTTLFTDAYAQRIVIVTPTTLLPTLKTIENLWRFEHQNNNAKEIADRAGSIYDKLCGFLEDMEKIGRQLNTCTSTYDSALNKLSTGRGNVITQAGKLKELGVKTKKEVPQSIALLADDAPPN